MLSVKWRSQHRPDSSGTQPDETSARFAVRSNNNAFGQLRNLGKRFLLAGAAGIILFLSARHL